MARVVTALVYHNAVAFALDAEMRVERVEQGHREVKVRLLGEGRNSNSSDGGNAKWGLTWMMSELP